jgi:hypothetical protein
MVRLQVLPWDSTGYSGAGPEEHTAMIPFLYSGSGAINLFPALKNAAVSNDCKTARPQDCTTCKIARPLKIQLFLQMPVPGFADRKLVARMKDCDMIILSVRFNTVYLCHLNDV